MHLPIQKSPLKSSPLNITYDEITSLDWDDFKEWCDDLKSEILNVWNEQNIPPYIGKTEDEIIKSFSKLKSYDITQFYHASYGDKDQDGFIKNFSKVGSSVNQFFPHMLKTKINGKSMYDWFSNDELTIQFRRTMVRALRLDGMYSFSQYLSNPNGVSDTTFFQKYVMCILTPLK